VNKESLSLPTWTPSSIANPYIGMILNLMDFITNLPFLKIIRSILVVVDYLTKMAHFVHCNKIIIGEKTTKLFFDHFH
jgi:hypothetical protein